MLYQNAIMTWTERVVGSRVLSPSSRTRPSSSTRLKSFPNPHYAPYSVTVLFSIPIDPLWMSVNEEHAFTAKTLDFSNQDHVGFDVDQTRATYASMVLLLWISSTSSILK